MGQEQDRLVGGRSLWSQVPEPLAGLARGRKSCFLAALVSGGNDSILEAAPRKMPGEGGKEGTGLSCFLVGQPRNRKAVGSRGGGTPAGVAS